MKAGLNTIVSHEKERRRSEGARENAGEDHGANGTEARQILDTEGADRTSRKDVPPLNR